MANPADFIEMPARMWKEAQLADNDTWPGDMVQVHIGTLASEAAHLAARVMITAMDAEILAAFRAGKDYVVAETWPSSKGWTIGFSFKGRRAEPGEFDNGLPRGWKLYRLRDWQEGLR